MIQVDFRGQRVFVAFFRSDKAITLCAVLFAMAFAMAFACSATALPIHSDTFWAEGAIPASVTHGDKSKKAGQIRRLTEYIRKTYKIQSNLTIAIITDAIHHGDKHDIRPELILAIIGVESTFRQRAVSSKGARGLMQILPRAHPKKVRAIGGIDALFDRRKNIATGVAIFHEYLDRSNGNLRRALLRYNGSLSDPHSKYAKKVLGLYRKFRKITNLDSLS